MLYQGILYNRETFLKRREAKFHNWVSNSSVYKLESLDPIDCIKRNINILKAIAPELFYSYLITDNLELQKSTQHIAYSRLFNYEADTTRRSHEEVDAISVMFKRISKTTIHFWFKINHYFSDAISNRIIAEILSSSHDINVNSYNKNNIYRYISARKNDNLKTTNYLDQFINAYKKCNIEEIEQKRFSTQKKHLELTSEIIDLRINSISSGKITPEVIVKCLALTVEKFFGYTGLYIGINSHGREPLQGINPLKTIGWLNELRPFIVTPNISGQYCTSDISNKLLKNTLYGRNLSSIINASFEKTTPEKLRYPSICLNITYTKWFKNLNFISPPINSTALCDNGAYRITDIGVGVLIEDHSTAISFDYSNEKYNRDEIKKIIRIFIGFLTNEINISNQVVCKTL
ncbi:hypothetical protein LGZ99_08745 [Photorhabdus temperata]|uniref:Condensation domain-containing protein n=1 Tax=Photorhabdus temperata subsp. temperata Meg1 TaxID=1393735 RepID=A0A081RZJ4_PHOTE|nr:hypothetical protein [Photorhabdus temperata]KER04097.1 hypothetical protein MEG1DRAFT_01211 [Photorhabdus temperata subsp. temperata Meg1]MCT8347292.1 hypothetical protein [Photorhabdus temperata]